MKTNLSIWQRASIIFILYLFMGGFYPFEINAVLLGRLGYLLSYFSCIVLLFITIIYKRGKIVFPTTNFNIIVFVLFVYFFIWGIYLGSKMVVGFAVATLVAYSFITLVINLIDFRSVILFFQRFTIFSGIMTVIGLILFSLGKLPLISTLDKGYSFIQNYGFFFVKILDEPDVDLLYVRPAGYFDEPGSFAYIAMLMLVLNKIYFKNKTAEFLLIFLPLVTTSLAHIITSIVYIFLFYVNYKRLKSVWLILLGFIACYFLLDYYADKNSMISYLNTRTVGRLESFISGEGGNSRQSGFDLGGKLVSEYPFGVSPEFIRKKHPGFSLETIYSVPLLFGFIGVLFYFLPFFYGIWRIVKTSGQTQSLLIKVLIIWGINLFQRPFYVFPFSIFALYFVFFYEFEKDKCKETQ